MKKKLLSLVMAAAMVLGLAACGSSADTTDTGSAVARAPRYQSTR